MSHFSVIVIGENPDALLQPYHEFECTGTNDQYVQEIDRTEEARADFAKATRAVVLMPDGTHKDWWSDEFYRDPTPEEAEAIAGGNTSNCYTQDWGDGLGRRTKVHYVPDGCERSELPEEDFRSWCEDNYSGKCLRPGQSPDLEEYHKYGWIELDTKGDVVRVVRRTNPGAKWDWWQVGGRYSDRLLLKAGGRTDQGRAGEIDWEGMRRGRRLDAERRWSAFEKYYGQHPETKGWKQVLAEHSEDVKTARAAYGAQAAVEGASSMSAREEMETWECPVDTFGWDKAAYVGKHESRPLSAFALLMDGKWSEIGEMGWFGAHTTEIGEEEWTGLLNDTLQSLPPDALITIVDCHI